MDVDVEGIGNVTNLVTQRPHHFRSPSTLLTSFFDRGAGRLRKLFKHVGCAWSHMMINILW